MRQHRNIAPMRAAKWGYIIISVIMCVLGIVLIAKPDLSVALPGIICGVVLVLFGIVRLVGYFSKDLYRLAFQYDLALGIVMIICGVLLLINPKTLLTVTCIALGISILIDSVFKFQIALEAKRFGISEWWLITVSAVLAGLCSVILLFSSESSRIIAIMMGISLITEAIMNIITVITAVKIVRNQQPDVVEITIESEEL